ncbi:MAG: hypothetical protein SGI84_07975 [Gemmatimonadota bacterium]|nr:hypothetical protein [Gemmatimonadota bacterium]
MILTKDELIAALQDDTRIVLHLIGKIDRSRLDYRPTPNQRSTIEVVRYISMMGPTIMEYATAAKPDLAVWGAAEEASVARDLDQCAAVIAGHGARYAGMLGGLSDADFRSEVADFDGSQTPRGKLIATWVLCGTAAYRMQLFLYLKASGREDLSTNDLWSGVDTPPG